MLPTILIVDDQEFIRDTLAALLATENLNLIFAANGEMGLKLAQEHKPDAMLLDIMMTGMDGYEVCRRIRANPDLAEMPVIMITALDDRNSRLVGLLAGADDFLVKPFDGFEIQVRVKNIMRLNRYRKLVAERSRFNWVIEHDEKGYLILDAHGEIEYANPRAQVYFHLPEKYAGINFDRQAARYYQLHMGDAEQPVSTDVHVAYLVQPESATARAFWLRVESLRSPEQSKYQRLLRVTDITDKMSAHQDTRKMHLMVAHKLRTPVSLIYSNMNLLDTKMDLIPTDEIKPMIKTAWRSANRLVLEVHDILKYMDAPLALTDGTPFVLEELEGMVKAIGGMLEIQDLSVSMPGFMLPYKIALSNKAMELIVHEILENSKKFHPSHAPMVEVQVEGRSENYVQIQFVDDGQTMTAEQLTRAQMPYSQGEKWFTGEVPGMGLGIPTVAALVWQSGGYFRIENRDSQIGVCVNLTLPLLKE